MKVATPGERRTDRAGSRTIRTVVVTAVVARLEGSELNMQDRTFEAPSANLSG